MTFAVVKILKKYRVEILLVLILVFSLMILKQNIVEKFQDAQVNEENEADELDEADELRNRLLDNAGASLSQRV
jgi:predicted membrane protein